MISQRSGGSDSSSPGVIGCALGFIGLVAAGLLVLVGTFAWIGISDVRHQAVLLERSVETPATIMSSKVSTQTSTTRTSGGGHSTTTIHIPEVRFTYQFGGRARMGQRVYPTARNGDLAWAKRVVAGFPVGAEVSAWVDPANPDESFLIREFVVSSYAMILAAAVGVAILMAFASLVGFLYRPVSRAACAVGVVAPGALVAFAGAHYWGHARPTGAGMGLPELLGTLALASALIPIAATAIASHWRRKLLGRSEEDRYSEGSSSSSP